MIVVPDFRPLLPVENPWRFYSKYADGGGVVRSEADQTYYIFGAANCHMALTCPQLLSDTPARRTRFVFGQTVVDSDSIEHLRFKRAIKNLLSLRNQTWSESINNAVALAIEGLPADGEAEMVEMYSSIIPIAVIAEAFGIHRSSLGDLKTALAAVVAYIDGDSGASVGDCLDARDAIRELIDFNSTTKGFAGKELQRLISRGVMSKAEADSHAIMLLAAATETTSRSISNTLLFCLENQLDMELLTPAQIRTALAYYPPLHWIYRRVDTDMQIGGERWEGGSSVQICIASVGGKRRGTACPESELYAFGKGHHACPGYGIAMLEIEESLKQLKRKFTWEEMRESPPMQGRIFWSPPRITLRLSHRWP